MENKQDTKKFPFKKSINQISPDSPEEPAHKRLKRPDAARKYPDAKIEINHDPIKKN